MDITEFTLAQLSSAIADKRVSATEAVKACFARIRDTERLNNFITLCESAALRDAALADEAIARGNPVGPLCGVPIAVKDNIDVRGSRTTCASAALSDRVADADAEVVRKLKSAGAIIIGKTNMDEFAMGSTNENSAFGATLNAIDDTRVTGGSSGGSANCVAARQAYGAIGSDTGGSIRQPAAYCGVVGLKPTHGVVDRTGMIGLAPSLDCIGTLTRDCDDAALMFGSISKRGSGSGITLDGDMRGKTIGIVDLLCDDRLESGVAQAFYSARKALESVGAKTVRVVLPSFAAAILTYHILSSAEASYYLDKYVRSDEQKRALGGEVKRRIITGVYVSSGARYDELYAKAIKTRTVIASEYVAALENCDAVICPTAPNTAHVVGEKIAPSVAHYNDMYAAPVSLAGLPAVSVPFGESDGLPVGIQIVGRPNDEFAILGIGKALQSMR